MDRLNRLAHLLSTSGRIAQPLDAPEPRHHKPIRPSRGDVKPDSHLYRDTDDLRDEADDEEDDELRERGEGSNLLFGGDDDDEFDTHEPDEQIEQDTLRKSRIKLLAGMIWAELGEPDAVVEESAPNELSIRVQDLSWKVAIDDDGRVTISGFDSGAEQYVGTLDDDNVETKIVKVADGIQQLLAEDIDRKAIPPEPPVHYGPEDTSVIDQPEGGEMPLPAAPGGDQGVPPPDSGLPAPDMGAAAGGADAFPPPGGGPPAPAPGSMPPNLPAAPGAGVPPAPLPTASRRRLVLPPRVVRVANTKLEEVSNQLENIGDALGTDGEEVFGKLADRVRRVVDLLR